MTPQASSAPTWLGDIRKIALLTFVSTVLGLLIPIWENTQKLLAIAAGQGWFRWIIPEVILLYLFEATMPLFYFALYRNRGTLRFPKNLRLLSLITAIVFGSYAAWDMWRWALARDPWTLHHVGILLGECSNLAYILLLVAFFRQSDDESFAKLDVPASAFLRRATKGALVLWGIWVAFNLVRVGVTPLAYSQLRIFTLQTRLSPPQLGHMMLEVIQMLLTQACLFIAPYVVYNSWSRGDESQDEVLLSPVERLPN